MLQVVIFFIQDLLKLFLCTGALNLISGNSKFLTIENTLIWEPFIAHLYPNVTVSLRVDSYAASRYLEWPQLQLMLSAIITCSWRWYIHYGASISRVQAHSMCTNPHPKRLHGVYYTQNSGLSQRKSSTQASLQQQSPAGWRWEKPASFHDISLSTTPRR